VLFFSKSVVFRRNIEFFQPKIELWSPKVEFLKGVSLNEQSDNKPKMMEDRVEETIMPGHDPETFLQGRLVVLCSHALVQIVNDG
jgi:hypothetical protein